MRGFGGASTAGLAGGVGVVRGAFGGERAQAIVTLAEQWLLEHGPAALRTSDDKPGAFVAVTVEHRVVLARFSVTGETTCLLRHSNEYPSHDFVRGPMDSTALRQRARERAGAGIDIVWREYVAWLTETFPRVAANLDPPAPADARVLDEIERVLGVRIPEPLSTLYRLTGGEPRFRQDPDDDVGSGVLFGARLMQVPEILEFVRAPRNWRPDDVDADREDDDLSPALRNEVLEPTKLRAAVLHRLWVPFAELGGGDYLAVDLAPGPGGSRGQVINIGRDQECRFVLADGITELIALLHELGASGIVYVVEGEDDGSPKSATVFAPTEVSLTDQLRSWFFPDLRPKTFGRGADVAD